jgi:hypothetical protein
LVGPIGGRRSPLGDSLQLLPNPRMSRNESAPPDPAADLTRRLQRRLDRLLAGPETPTVRASGGTFSPYDDADLRRATQLAAEMMALADEQGGESGLDTAVRAAERSLHTEKPGVVVHAVQLFLAHHPLARRLLRTPALTDRLTTSAQPPRESRSE